MLSDPRPTLPRLAALNGSNRPHHPIRRPRLHPLLALGLLPCAAFSPGAEAETAVDEDFHFRPFWVEPADRIDFGHGHLVAGIDHELRPEPGTRRRTATPLEATLGLGLGFSVMLGLDGGARSVFDDGSRSWSANRDAKLRYSLPEWRGVNFMLLAGIERPSGPGQHDTLSQGYSVAFDTPAGTLSLGQTWNRKRPEDHRAAREAGINFFRVGLGGDPKWAAGAEFRYEETARGPLHRHGLVGIGRIVGKGLMADLALGMSEGEQTTRRLVTAGISWFF